jgi:hypothetical protein
MHGARAVLCSPSSSWCDVLVLTDQKQPILFHFIAGNESRSDYGGRALHQCGVLRNYSVRFRPRRFAKYTKSGDLPQGTSIRCVSIRFILAAWYDALNNGMFPGKGGSDSAKSSTGVRHHSFLFV